MARPQITINQGTLEGKQITTDTGFIYNAFLGIPYAKPPVGELRFKEPQAADGWDGVRDASVEGNVCAHIDIFFKKAFTGEEDCLYLNVYVPNGTTVDSALPVMFWIHGGAFTAGSGSKEIYGPDHMISKNVIIVTFNYRLGPFGFLCLHTPEAAGNAGLKDQLLALKWVNENIKRFGGDSENITIFGESAGAGSVSYLTVSPTTRGLYSKAINQSGTSINCWSTQSDPIGVAFQLGELLGIKTDDKKELYNHFMKIPAEILVKASCAPQLGVDSQIAFSPVIENTYLDVKPFITELPRDIIKKGNVNKVPTITGFNSNEGVLLAMKLEGMDLSKITLNQIIPDFREFVPKYIRPSLDAEGMKTVAQKIKNHYFENEDNLLDRYYEFMSDFVFVKDIQASVKLLTPLLPSMYNYRFSYNGSLNVMKLLWNIPYKGAAHADELGYLHKPSLNDMKLEVNETDIAIINLMTEMWTNFAKYGNPTPKLSENVKVIWQPVTKDAWNCLDIDEETKLIQEPFAERMKFWENISLLGDL